MSVRNSVKTFDWHKLMFVLPNLFTVSSIFCGFYSMILSTQERWIGAAISIFFANFFDTFDGRVARMTKTQSEFGTEMDSLADVISFGVAPAFLVYQWSLKDLGLLGAVISFLFAMCGALRLARFNVLAHRHVPGSSDFFVGLPIPLGAGTIFALVLAQEAAGSFRELKNSPAAVAVIVVLTALLMVSNIRYRTFKNTKFTKKAVAILGAILLTGVVLAVVVLHPAVVLLIYFLAYLAMGICEGIIGLFRRKPVEQTVACAAAASDGTAAAIESPDADAQEEELAEEEEDSGMDESEDAAKTSN